MHNGVHEDYRVLAVCREPSRSTADHGRTRLSLRHCKPDSRLPVIQVLLGNRICPPICSTS
jgi:hypothetical protein